jgi:hypothetical protein
MNSLKKIINTVKEGSRDPHREMILTLSEIDEITDKLVSRIEKKVTLLKSLSGEADQRIAILDGLITKYKSIHLPVQGPGDWSLGEKNSQGEVRVLANKGFSPEQIARIMDLPSGEVELMLNLVH